MDNIKRWILNIDKVIYFDDNRIIFESNGLLYAGDFGSLRLKNLTSSYSDEELAIRCNKIQAYGRAY